jgi:hypothetical protein
LGNKFLLADRIRIEFRWLRGDSGFVIAINTAARKDVFESEIRISPYVHAEAYRDFHFDDGISLNSAAVGDPMWRWSSIDHVLRAPTLHYMLDPHSNIVGMTYSLFLFRAGSGLF